MTQLVLLRHGESQWNMENLFTGWIDIDLSKEGKAQARKAGQLLLDGGFTLDLAFTSVLKRAIRTLWIVLDQMDLMWIPVEHSWRLNERHYGALQGLNKRETAQRYGEEQVAIWRRSYEIPPPPLAPADARQFATDPRYQSLMPADMPLSECLKDTLGRFMPYWHEAIVPQIRARKKVLIAAHGNSLRALVKHLDEVTDREIVEMNIPTGVPLVYDLDDNLKPLKHYYLGDPEEVQRATQAVANQAKAK